MADSAPLPEFLVKSGVIAPLPAIAPELMYAACEVMIQEGVTAWTVPSGEIDTARALLGLFDGRAVVGLRGKVDPGVLDRAQDAGVSFVCLSSARVDTVDRGAEIGIAVVSGALTPTEIEHAWESRPSAVQVIPADLLGAGYTEFLRNELPDVPIVATGRIDSYQAEQWLEDGAIAVCPTADLIGNALSGGVLMGLRVRSRDYASASERARVSRDLARGLAPEDS